MASLKEIEIKNLIEFEGHIDETYLQGDIHWKGIEIGWFSEDSWGGPMEICLNHKEDWDKFHSAVKKFTGKSNIEEYDEEKFIFELVELINKEKSFTEANKKGYRVLVVVQTGKGYFEIYTNTNNIIEIVKWLDTNGYSQYKSDTGKYLLEIYTGLKGFIQ